MGFTKKTGEQKIQQGSGRSIRGYWTIGVIGLLILTAAVWSYLFYQNQLTTQAQQKKQTKAITQALAISITTILKQRMELIQGLAHQPALAELFDQVDTQDLQVEQARLTRLVPDVMRIRLLPKGVEQPDTDAKPHMGYASLQLLRQAEESETVLPAEMHQFGTTHQHIAIASSIPSTNGVDVSGVLHAAFPTDTLLKLLDGIEDYAGRVELQQVFAGKEPFALAGKGAIVATGDRPDGVIPLKGSIWQIAYWGGTGTGMQADLIESLMLIVPGVLFFLFTALLLFRLSQRMTNALKSDQHNILSLMEALVVGRPPKHQPAQLSDLKPTLDVLEHQVRE
ncbi:MAG: hypothetical protein KZQ79_02445, partial [Candidatus Thiodiazotropha sp. (ex Lucinoma borealis)]|nr:hypothetical protein [Candidatus Thiodiazotropha sp. (ex Lucinoma borealis)]